MRRIYIDDVVRVVDKESVHFDKLGIVLPNMFDHMYVVALDRGRTVHQFRRSEVVLAARKGTKSYSNFLMTGAIAERSHPVDVDLSKEDYCALIDLALDLKDFELAQQWFDEMQKIK